MTRGPCENHEFVIESTIIIERKLSETVSIKILGIPAKKCSHCPKKNYDEKAVIDIIKEACNNFLKQ